MWPWAYCTQYSFKVLTVCLLQISGVVDKEVTCVFISLFLFCFWPVVTEQTVRNTEAYMLFYRWGSPCALLCPSPWPMTTADNMSYVSVILAAIEAFLALVFCVYNFWATDVHVFNFCCEGCTASSLSSAVMCFSCSGYEAGCFTLLVNSPVLWLLLSHLLLPFAGCAGNHLRL